MFLRIQSHWKKKLKKKLWNIIKMSKIYLGHYLSLGWNYVKHWWVGSLHQVHCMQFSLRWEYHLVCKAWCTKILLGNKSPKKHYHTLQYKNMRSMWIILNINMLKLKSNIVKTKFIQPSLNNVRWAKGWGDNKSGQSMMLFHLLPQGRSRLKRETL
jgi:hypothetical protein